jgi:hypothetical protein
MYVARLDLQDEEDVLAFKDLMAEAEQFALDASVPPSWILPGQPDHQQIQEAKKHER